MEHLTLRLLATFAEMTIQAFCSSSRWLLFWYGGRILSDPPEVEELSKRNLDNHGWFLRDTSTTGAAFCMPGA